MVETISNKVDSIQFINHDEVLDLINESCKIDEFLLYENKSKLYNTILNLNNKKETRYYCLYDRNNLDKELLQIIDDDNKSGIIASYCIFSLLNINNLPKIEEFILLDDNKVIKLFNDSFILDTDSQCVSNCIKILENINENNETFFLQEYLHKSAHLMSEAALVLCSYDHMNLCGCYWYHSIWQWLRLLNMVSTPSWHHHFYKNQLYKILEGKNDQNILISGTADYSSLAYTIKATEEAQCKNNKFEVLDLCETPLFACKWYGSLKNIDLETLKKSIFELDYENKYDLICTDAFLTRFTKQQICDILNIWKKALRKNGKVLTTVRVYDDKYNHVDVPHNEKVAEFKQKAYDRAVKWHNINISPLTLSVRAEEYAKTMKSNKIGTQDEILKSFADIGLKIIHLEEVEVAGELYLSKYLRIVAERVE